MMSALITVMLALSPAVTPVPPVFAGCNPPPDLCSLLGEAAVKSGLPTDVATKIESLICPGSARMACDTAIAECDALDLDCKAVAELCDDALLGCGHSDRCEPTRDLSLPELFALCVAHPWALGDDCAEPSAGQCFAILTLSDDLCDVTTCEYMQCADDLDALATCSADLPPSCDKLAACDAAENGCEPIDELDPFMFCATHPLGHAASCEDPVSIGLCEAHIGEFAACGASTCEVDKCRAAMLEAPCGVMPAECTSIMGCAGGPTVPGPDDWSPAPPLASQCLRLTEVFTSLVGPAADHQFVRLTNTCRSAVSAAGIDLRWTQPDKGWSGGTMDLDKLEKIEPGACVTVGGPVSAESNGFPTFDLGQPFLPALSGSAGPVAGVGLFRNSSSLPFDVVAFGSGSSTFPGVDGTPAVSSAADMEVGHSLRRASNGWFETPAPGPAAASCTSLAP